MKEISLKDLIIEELHYEYKKAKGGLPKSFWESYSAFANSDGGCIFLGVEEIKTRTYVPAQLTSDEALDLKNQIFSLANNKEKVNVNLLSDEDIEEVLLEGFPVLCVRVKRCPRELRPIYINCNIYQGTYRRNSDGDYHCDIEEINSMIRDSSIKATDLLLLDEYDISSLDLESIKEYKNIFSAMHPNHPFLSESNNRFLEYIGAARIDKNGEYHPTAAGLLMFGFSYRIVYEFPNYFLDYQLVNDENRWNDRIQSDSGDWSGNVFSFFKKVSLKLTNDVDVPFEMKGIYRIDDTELHKAIREALCNTLCNADYHIKGEVIIKRYEDHITFINPGCLMMDINQMIKGGESEARNKTLLKMFNLIGIGERSGSGIPLIFNTAKNKMLPTPAINEQFNPDKTVLTLFISKRVAKNKDDLSVLEKNIVNYVTSNGPCGAKEISVYLKKNITTVKLSLYHLVDLNILKTSGTIKDKKYYR